MAAGSGFFAEGTLKKVAVAGGLVQTVARDVSDPVAPRGARTTRSCLGQGMARSTESRPLVGRRSR